MKYNIAGYIWEINFTKNEGTKKYFESFLTSVQDEPRHTINFSIIDTITPLKETNEVENGLKMYVEDGIKLFDIVDDDKKVMIRGKYQNDTSTFYFLKDFKEMDKYEYILTYMRFSEMMSQEGFVSLNASCVTIGDQALIAAGSNERIVFVTEWLKNFNTCELISNDKLIIRLDNNFFKVYASPWSGEQPTNNNREWVLQAILFLEKAITNKFVDINDEQKAILLATNLGIMTDTLSNDYLMQFCLDLVEKVDIFKYKGKIKDINSIFKKIYFN